MANHGAICLGRDMEEAFTCCEVLDKGCKAFIEAEFMGGAKSINRFEAALMHQIYLKKILEAPDEEIVDAPLILSFDVGTTSTKSCLYRMGSPIELSGQRHEVLPYSHRRGGDGRNRIRKTG